MLVISRKAGQAFKIGEDIRVSIERIGPNTVRIGIKAPNELNIAREELIDVGNSADVIVLDRAGGADPVRLGVGGSVHQANGEGE